MRFLVSAGEFNPDYLRKSQAERQREAELSPEALPESFREIIDHCSWQCIFGIFPQNQAQKAYGRTLQRLGEENKMCVKEIGRIRLMEEKDVKQVEQVEKQCFSVPWSEHILKDGLTGRFDTYLVWEKGGIIAGYCALRVLCR